MTVSVLLAVLLLPQSAASTQSTAKLLALSRSRDPVLRVAATKSLAQLDDPKAGQRMMQLAGDATPDVRAEVVLINEESGALPALVAWRRALLSEVYALQDRLGTELSAKQQTSAKARIQRLRGLYNDTYFLDRKVHIGWLAEYGRSLEPGPQFVRVFRALLNHVSLRWLGVVNPSWCGTVSGTSYVSNEDIVAMYRKAPEVLDDSVQYGWDEASCLMTLVLASTGDESHVRMVGGMAENAVTEWRVFALATLPLLSRTETEARAAPILERRSGLLRAVAAMALLTIDAPAHFDKVSKALLSDGEAARAYMEIAQWQYALSDGSSEYPTWRPPQLERERIAALAEESALRHEAFYAPHVIAHALGKGALPILRRLRPRVSETLHGPIDESIKQLEKGG